jgi:hypothetical protein
VPFCGHTHKRLPQGCGRCLCTWHCTGFSTGQTTGTVAVRMKCSSMPCMCTRRCMLGMRHSIQGMPSAHLLSLFSSLVSCLSSSLSYMWLPHRRYQLLPCSSTEPGITRQEQEAGASQELSCAPPVEVGASKGHRGPGRLWAHTSTSSRACSCQWRDDRQGSQHACHGL